MPRRWQWLHDHPAICSARLQLGRNNMPRPALFRYALPSAYQGDTHLPSDGNLRGVQLLLGHTKIESAVRYLGIEVDDALAIAEQVDV